MASSTNDDDNKVVRFPSTPEERRAHHRARQEAERQRLINLFLDEEAGNQALFRTPAGECYADLVETVSVRIHSILKARDRTAV
jgi:hypothetical protein